jgi:peptidylprolyl isomerase
MKQFGTALLVSLAFAMIFEGCQNQRPVLSQAAKAPLAPAITLPEGVPAVSALVATAFSLRYQDIAIGTGKDAEPNKIYKVAYTGWLAADGHKFDSSYDHKKPVIGKDGKPELDADGKPKTEPGDPISFPQGFGRVIPGFDQGFIGMKVGGKRRLFIPWQLAYGSRGSPGRGLDNSGIPPMSDLIFDIELVDVIDMPKPPARPMPLQPGASGSPAASKTPVPQSAPSASTPSPTAKPADPASKATPSPAANPATPASDKPQSTTDKPQSN